MAAVVAMTSLCPFCPPPAEVEQWACTQPNFAYGGKIMSATCTCVVRHVSTSIACSSTLPHCCGVGWKTVDAMP